MKLTTDKNIIDWWSAAQHIAVGLGAGGGAWSSIGGETFGVRGARFGGVESPYPAGTIVRCDSEVWVQTGCGHLIIDRIVDQSGIEQSAPAFFLSRNFGPGSRFDLQGAGAMPAYREISDAA